MNSIEKEIQDLKAKIKTLESQLQKEDVLSPEREKRIKETIKDFIRESQFTPSYSPPISRTDEVDEIDSLEEKTQQVGALINLALNKGVQYAVSVAKQLKNPSILDEFHDTLVDRYYKILVERGIIKE